MADRVIQRNDTAANWQSVNPILATGEIGIVIDGAKGYKIGDGVTPWNDLPYPANPTNVVQELGNNENAVISQKGVTNKLTDLTTKCAIFDKDNNIVKNPIEVVSNPEYIECHVDENGKILYGVKRNGEFVFNLFKDAESRTKMTPTVYKDIEKLCLSEVSIPTQLHPTGSAFIIRATNDLAASSNEIKNALKNGKKNIVVLIEQDVVCSEQIDLTYMEYPDANITFTSQGGKKNIIGSDELYSIDSDGASYEGGYVKVPYQRTFDINKSFSAMNGDSINLFDEQFIETDRLIEFNAQNGTVNKYKGVGKIYNTPYEDKPTSECTDLYVQITQWYLGSIYKVSKIEGGVIYFDCETSSGVNNNGVALNNDYYMAGVMPRYRLLNYRDGKNLAVEDGFIYIPVSIGAVYECERKELVKLDGCKLRSLTITNLCVSNNTILNIPVTAEFESVNILGNTFKNNNNIVFLLNSPNYHITHNTFVDCNNGVIRIEQGGKYGEVKHNLFKDCGKQNKNTFCVNASSDQVLIKQNEFIDYGYGAVCVGTWWNTELSTSFKCNVIVEENILTYTPKAYNRVERRGLIDSGAMYAYTNNTLSIFRYNIIANYTGAGSNRGIFLDDGAYNVMVYGNIILGVDNSYSIDSRLVSNVSSKVAKHNTNNVFLYNIVNSPYKLEGRDDIVNANCLKGVNVQLHTNDDKMENDVSWCNEEPDYHITEASIDNGVLLLPKRFNKMVQDVLPKELLSQIHFTY